jgi:hypothetical protein
MVFALIWAGHISKPPAWISSFGLGRLLSSDDAWLSAFTGTTLFGVAATLASTGLGSWYMLREK